MPTLDQIISNDPIRLLAWGVSGSGKTTLIGMMAKHEELRPIYVADFDLRIASLRARLDKEYWPFIESDPYRDVNIAGEAASKLKAKLINLDPKFKTLVIDSATFYMNAIMARVQMLAGKQQLQQPSLPDYGEQQRALEDTIKTACAKPYNFIITCHEQDTKDEQSGRVFKAVDLTGKSSGRIPGYFNELWHCELAVATEGNKYKIRTRSDFTYSARTSFKSLESVEDQDKIWGKIIKERNS